jgi:hypothetical protein
MNERNIIIVGGVLGAIAGVLATYMLFTPQGQRWRVAAERNLSSLAQEAGKLLAAADQVRHSVAELRGQTGWPRTA